MKHLHFLFFLCAFSFTKAQNHHPNIIYILADDMGYGDVSSLNKDSKIHTKNIDADGQVDIPLHVVVAKNEVEKFCILITAYYSDRNVWDSSFKNKNLIKMECVICKNGTTEKGFVKFRL